MQHVINGLKNSFNGIKVTYQEEKSFKIDILIALLETVILIFWDIQIISKIVLFITISLIIIVEIINTAIENTIDYISMNHHPLAKKAKDAGSAAVFLTIMMNIVCFIVIFVMS
jgi:diacylglycerol kinase (ATP)